MPTLPDLIASIEPVGDALGAATQAPLDQKTKPRRSLGRLESLACGEGVAMASRLADRADTGA